MAKTYPVPCSKEEIDAILDAASAEDYYFTLFFLAKTTGRRLGEYLSVQVKDIDFEKRVMMTLVLKRKMQIKKEALLTEEASRILKQFIIRNHLTLDQFVFEARKKSSIQAAIKRFSKKAGVNHNVMFHNFRHYFVTHLSKQGWSYDKIAKLTGHTTPQTLVHYDHTVATDVKDQAMKALQNI